MKCVSETALKALNEADHERAAELYKIKISMEPASVEAWNNLGICYALSGKSRKSVTCFKISKNINSIGLSISFNYAKSLLESELYELSASAFEECIKISFDNPILYIGAALSYSKMGEVDTAIAYYRLAIDLDPANSSAICGIGTTLESAGLVDQALTFFKRALAFDQSNHEAMVACMKHRVRENGVDEFNAHFSEISERNSVKLEIISDLIKRKQVKKAGKLIRGYSANRAKGTPFVHRGPYKNGFILATSVAPKNLDHQYSCLKGWMEQGFEVVSINTKEELRKIISAVRRFSRIDFVQAHRSADHIGKPLVYIDDVISHITTSPKDWVGIVNSDIMPSDDASRVILEKYGESLSRGSMVYSRRTDINILPNGRISDKSKFAFGFDMFFSIAGSMMTVGRSHLVFGAPWWDYWLPLNYCVNGIHVSEIMEEIGFHIRHDTNWSEEAYKSCGIEFLNSLGKLIGKTLNTSPTDDVSLKQVESMQLLRDMFSTLNEKITASEEISLDDLRMVNVVTLGAIDLYAAQSSSDVG